MSSPRITRYQMPKGGFLSIYQARWRSPHGAAFADLEVRDGDKMVVTYGLDGGSWWGVEVRSQAHGEAVIDWLLQRAEGRISKPQILADMRDDSLFRELPVVDSHQDHAAPLNFRQHAAIQTRQL